MWLLLIFWWGSNAGVITKVEAPSKAMCEDMAASVEKQSHDKGFGRGDGGGYIKTMCIKTDEHGG